MNNNDFKYNFTGFLFLLLSLIAITLYGVDELNSYKQNVSSQKSLKIEKQQLDEKVSELQDIKQKIEKGEIDLQDFNKFRHDLTEDELVEYFYDYASNYSAKVTINSLSIGEGRQNDFGFMEADIVVGFTFADEAAMISTIDDLIINSNKFGFYISNFNYALNSGNLDNIVTNIPLKVLYK